VDGDLITSADKLPASYKDACLLAICNASNIVNHSHIVKTRSAHYLPAMLRMKLHLFAKNTRPMRLIYMPLEFGHE